MDTPSTSWDDLALLDQPDDEGQEQVIAPAPVVAVIVTCNPGDWFTDTLESLRDQDYPDLTVLVLDAGSDSDPSLRVAEVLPNAYVRRTERTPSFATTANEALGSVEGATFLLFCHDDVALAPDAIRVMVQEAYRSNAAIVGPKIVSADDPKILLQVGMSIDRFGVPFSGIEPGEVDQEQHDGVRDTFFVSSATMLVRADIFKDLEGFDPDAFPGAEDLDLCWRTRLIGGRVIVEPDAVVRHREAVEERQITDKEDAKVHTRTRVRSMLKCYSKWSLAYLVPTALVLTTMESFVYLVRRQPTKAKIVAGAWWWNLRHWGALKKQRRKVQDLRRVPDRDLKFLQIKGSSRVKAFFVSHVRAEERLQTISLVSRRAATAASTRTNRTLMIAGSIFALAFLLGIRNLVLTGVPHFGSFASWPGVHNTFTAFGSGWRYSGMGSATAAPPAFAIMGFLTLLTLGHAGLAQTLVIILAIPVGSFGTFRLSRYFGTSATSGVVAALAYGLNPIARNIVSNGSLGALAFFMSAPFLLALLLNSAKAISNKTDIHLNQIKWWRQALPFAALLAVTTAFMPLAALYIVLIACALALTSSLLRDRVIPWAVPLFSLTGVVLSLVLLFPWPLSVVLSGVDRNSIGLMFRPDLSLGEVLRFATGQASSGWAGPALLIAALLPLIIATGTRFAWAVRAWVIALVGFAITFLPSAIAPRVLVPAPEYGLVLAALGIAIAIGLGEAAFVEDLRNFGFGWRQAAAVVATVAFIIPAFEFLVDVPSGRLGASSRSWSDELSFLNRESVQGDFRMLWVGDARDLPTDPVGRADNDVWSLTRGVGDARALLPAPAQHADLQVGRSLSLVAHGETTELGRMLVPAGVRYVAILDTPGPNNKLRIPASRDLKSGFLEQRDLTQLETKDGIMLFQNQAWVSTRAVVPAGKRVPAGSADSSITAAQTDLSSAKPLKGKLTNSDKSIPGTILWGESFNTAWHAKVNGKSLQHSDAFGMTNAFISPRSGSVSLHFDGQLMRNVAILLQLVMWLFVLRILIPRRQQLSVKPEVELVVP